MAKKRKKVVNQISAKSNQPAAPSKRPLIIILCIAIFALLLAGTVAATLIFGPEPEPVDPHAGHDHSNMTEEELEAHLNGDTTSTSAADEHAGHDHSNMTEEELEAHLNGEDTASTEEQNIIDPAEPIYADITVANYGTITVELDRNEAPITVDNFVQLAGNGFYDGLTFHRIMEGFMMQGGDPDGNGTGGSGYNVTGEFSANGVDNKISHTRGTISMARSSDFDSASSQFFIVHEDSTFLDGQYAGFGRVVEGMEYVDAICTDAQPTDNNGTIPAEQQPVIESIVIRNS